MLPKHLHWKRSVLLVLLLAILLKAGMISWHAYGLWTHGMRLKALLGDPGAALKPAGLMRAESGLLGVELALRGLRADLGLVLRPLWSPWRSGRENRKAADEVLAAGAELARAGQIALGGLHPMAEALEQSRGAAAGNTGHQDMTELLLTGLIEARPSLTAAGQHVSPSMESIAALKADALWSPLSRVVGAMQRYFPLGRAGLGALAAAPVLLGEGGPVNYLLLAQNSDELRATGGFITGIGVVTLERGKIAALTISDSYDFDKFTVDHPDPPEAMRRYMGIDLWVTRDGNWSPDFPTSARDVESLFHLEHSLPLDGVLAFDLAAVQILVQAIGPIKLDGIDEPIDGANVMRFIRDSWSPTLPEGKSWDEWRKENQGKDLREWWYHRKDVMGILAKALLARVQSQGEPASWMKLLWALKSSMDEKHVQTYFHDRDVQEFLKVTGWDGALVDDSTGDYLLVVDTNTGYNKVNLNVQKTMEYRVTLRKGSAPEATLTITYTNRSTPERECVAGSKMRPTYDEMARDCFWDFLRIYVPSGSQLLAAEGVTETERLVDEKGRAVFATYFVVPASAQRTVRFTYALPEQLTSEYRLRVQKQAGTDTSPIAVRIALSPDMRVALSRPAARLDSGLVCYDWSLREDISVVLKLR